MIEVMPLSKDKGTIMTDRSGKQSLDDNKLENEFTLVNNSCANEEILTAA